MCGEAGLGLWVGSRACWSSRQYLALIVRYTTICPRPQNLLPHLTISDLHPLAFARSPLHCVVPRPGPDPLVVRRHPSARRAPWSLQARAVTAGAAPSPRTLGWIAGNGDNGAGIGAMGGDVSGVR